MSKAQRNVAAALRKHSRSMENWVRFRGSAARLRPRTANAFLLGVMLDRSVLFQRAWDSAEWIVDAVGDVADPAVLWRNLQDMERRRLLGFMRYGYGGKAFHRHYKTFARTLPMAAEHLLKHYDGDPRKIWNGQTDVDLVRQRLDAIPNIGPGLANMAVMNLVRNKGLLGGKKARRRLDVKPDIHVNRVFRRTGIVASKSPTDNEIIEAARTLAPDYPGALDAPAWEIGQKWCRPTRPRCSDCKLTASCPRVGVRSHR